MDRTEVTCTDTDTTVGADILSKSDRVLKVVADGSTMSITLYKKTPTSTLYIGSVAGMEFTSTGE